MRKKISFVSLDSSTALWLKDKLFFGGPNTDSCKELLEAIEDLISGKAASLMLEMNDGTPAATGNGIFCGELAIHPNSRKVLRSGIEIQLTPKEFDILYFLAKNRGDVFTKEQIYQAVWEEDYLLADSNIMAFIRKLRKKIEPNPDEPEYIITVQDGKKLYVRTDIKLACKPVLTYNFTSDEHPMLLEWFYHSRR